MKYLKRIIYIILTLIIPIQVLAGGIIIVSPSGTSTWVSPRFNPYTLESRSIKVDVKINGQYAKTTIEQVFYNPSSRNLQGYFLFPVPKGAVIKNFSMNINGKMMQAELLDAKKARKIYEDIVRKSLDPALLEYSEQALFKLRIFPIEARKEKRIKITYTEVLDKDNNTTEYQFPLNTKKYSAKPLHNVAIKIDIESNSKIKTLYSPSHDVETIRKSDNKAVIGFEAKNVKPTSDFKLYIGYDKSKIGMSLLSYKGQSNNGFFMLNISPGLIKQQDKIVSKDITFVLDVSGSMTGENIKQAKNALNFCIDNLNKKDKFEIVKFSTEAEALFKKRVVANSSNIQQAKTFIKNIRAIGGTNIAEAFELACKEKQSADRPHMIIFITDGKPTIGETNESRLVKQIIKSNSESTRIFTFGIGDNINTHLLDKITKETKAYRSYIAPNEDIEIKISNFYNKISSPILTDIKLSFGSGVRVNKVYPKELPDIFKGSSITVLGRFNKTAGTTITLEGKVNGRTEKFTYKAKFNQNSEYDFIAPLWATRNVGYLLDQIRLNGTNKELVDEVISLSKKYGIITPYTSYLILEDEKINITRRRIPRERVIFNSRFARTDNFMDDNEEEFNNLGKKSGRGSIQSSSEVQNLNKAKKLKDITQGSSRMVYVDKNGNTQNFAKQVRNIQGRAFYQNGKQWTDLYVQKSKIKKFDRIKFASKEYFALINNSPKTARYLSLGRNVRFVHNKKLYEIYE